MQLLSEKGSNHLDSLVRVDAVMQGELLQQQIAKLGLNQQQQQSYFQSIEALPYSDTKEKQYFMGVLRLFYQNTDGVFLSRHSLEFLFDVVRRRTANSLLAVNDLFLVQFYASFLEELLAFAKVLDNASPTFLDKIIIPFFKLSERGRDAALHLFKRCITQLSSLASNTDFFFRLFEIWLQLCWKKKDIEQPSGVKNGYQYFHELWTILVYLEQNSKYSESLLWCLEQVEQHIQYGSESGLLSLQDALSIDHKTSLIRSTHSTKFSSQEIFGILHNLSFQYNKWIDQFGFEKYISYLPTFLINEELRARGMYNHTEYRQLSNSIIQHLLEGKNIRTFEMIATEGMLPFNKKAAHIFHNNIPKDFNLQEAFLYATLKTYNLSTDYTFELLMTYFKRGGGTCSIQNVTYHITRDVKYIESMVFFFKKYENMLDRAEQETVLQFFIFQKNKEPNFTLKGRNPQSIFRLIPQTGFKSKNMPWETYPIEDFYTEERGISYRIIQLKTPLEVEQEGSAMRHCVGGYVYKCRNGSVAIWSLQEQISGEWKRKVTIEMNKGRRIVQTKMFANKAPTLQYQNVLDIWKKHI